MNCFFISVLSDVALLEAILAKQIAGARLEARPGVEFIAERCSAQAGSRITQAVEDRSVRQENRLVVGDRLLRAVNVDPVSAEAHVNAVGLNLEMPASIRVRPRERVVRAVE